MAIKGCEDWVCLRNGEYTIMWKVLQHFTGYTIQTDETKPGYGEIDSVSACVKLLNPPPLNQGDVECWMEGPERTALRWATIEDVWSEASYRKLLLRYFIAHDVPEHLYARGYSDTVD